MTGWRIGSLFSGVGGLELGLERAGLGEVVWQVEREPYCQRVLANHWPHAKRYDDVTTVGAHNLESVDVICGGFPCQDLSYAGRGAGLSGTRSGLWFEMLRIIQEVRPRVVIAENVAALRTRGLPVVVAGLRDAGYRVVVVPCSTEDVGATQERKRIFICAINVGNADGRGQLQREGTQPDERRWTRNAGSPLVDTSSVGQPRSGAYGHAVGEAAASNREAGVVDGASKERARVRSAQPNMGRTVDGLSGWLDGIGRFAAEVAKEVRWPARPGQPQHAWEAPRVAKGVRDRSHRLKALGNAVAPPVAEAVGRWVLRWCEYEMNRGES